MPDILLSRLVVLFSFARTSMHSYKSFALKVGRTPRKHPVGSVRLGDRAGRLT